MTKLARTTRTAAFEKRATRLIRGTMSAAKMTSLAGENAPMFSTTATPTSLCFSAPASFNPSADHDDRLPGLLEPANKLELFQRALIEPQLRGGAKQAAESLPIALMVAAHQRELIVFREARHQLACVWPDGACQLEIAAMHPGDRDVNAAGLGDRVRDDSRIPRIIRQRARERAGERPFSSGASTRFSCSHIADPIRSSRPSALAAIPGLEPPQSRAQQRLRTWQAPLAILPRGDELSGA